MARNQKGRTVDQPAGGSLSEIDKALASLQDSGEAPDTIPDGWKTVPEWAELLKKKRAWTAVLINRQVDKGVWEHRIFRSPSGNRGVYPTHYYRKKPD